MKIWELSCDMMTRYLTFDHETAKKVNHPLIKSFNGQSIKDKWMPIKLEHYKKGKYKDFPYLKLGVLVFSRKSYDQLIDLVKCEVEFLEAEYADYEIFIGNIINIIDCLDKKKSVPDGFGGYKKIVFSENIITYNTSIFIIPELKATQIFVTDHFVNAVRENKLKGLTFTEVWDSEFSDAMEQEQKDKHDYMLAEIERTKGIEFSYDQACEKIDNGLAVASGKWRMQRDEFGTLWLGQLAEDCQYHWLMPIYIPPVLLGYRWHEVERMIISKREE